MTRSLETRDCAVCGSSEKRLLFRQHFAGGLEGALFSGFDVVVCSRCGFGRERGARRSCAGSVKSKGTVH